MSKGINKVILVANLGKDPETRYTGSGAAVTSFSVATSETWNDKKSGEKQEKTEWHNITAFGKLGEICGQYLKKGSKVYIEGKLSTDKYEKDGVTRYSTSIIANSMQMLDGKPQDGQGQQSAPQQSAPQQNSGFDEDDQDIPW